ncbi:MAG TPA: DUF6585 family protein [Gemmataceae bacterium]|nr:DUF6585 family protein [Gemmataceae bacterium]
MASSSDLDLMLSDAERAALGAFRSAHPAASKMHKVNIAIAGVFTLVLMGAAVAFLIPAVKAPGKGMEIGAGIFAALGLLPAFALGYLLVKLRWKLYLFDKGFVFARSANRIVLWEDIQSLYDQQDVVSGIRADRWLRFLLQDGRRLTVDSSYKDFGVFAASVRDSVTKAVLARAATELPAGRAIAFGKLMLTKAGLKKPEESLPWTDVHSIAIEPRRDGQVLADGVVVYKRGVESKGSKEKVEWYVKLAPRFGNVDAFLRLASQFATIADRPDTQL